LAAVVGVVLLLVFIKDVVVVDTRSDFGSTGSIKPPLGLAAVAVVVLLLVLIEVVVVVYVVVVVVYVVVVVVVVVAVVGNPLAAVALPVLLLVFIEVVVVVAVVLVVVYVAVVVVVVVLLVVVIVFVGNPLRSETPVSLKAPETHCTNLAGHSTRLNFTFFGAPTFQPHDAKSLQPGLRAASNHSQRSMIWGSAVCVPRVYQSPRTPDFSLAENNVFSRSLQTFAVLSDRKSNPGTARSRCILPSSQPFDSGGHRLFFMTIADQSDSTASGFCMSKHLPQPGLSLSRPQHGSAAPKILASVSDAAPTSHIFSSYSAPPCSLGS